MTSIIFKGETHFSEEEEALSCIFSTDEFYTQFHFVYKPGHRSLTVEL